MTHTAHWYQVDTLIDFFKPSIFFWVWVDVSFSNSFLDLMILIIKVS